MLTDETIDLAGMSERFRPESVTRASLREQPQEYRDLLVYVLCAQAYAERLGATELAHWVKQAPGYRERRVLCRILADEAYHSYLLYRELDALGLSEAEAIALVESRSGGRSRSLDGPAAVADSGNDWLDLALNHMFLDRAGKFMVQNFTLSSYAPWAAACRRILRDEYLHEGFGYRELRRYLADPRVDGEHLARRATLWYAHGLNFFGPPNQGERAEKLRYYGLKRKSNQELRDAYRAEVAALLEKLGASHLIRLRSQEYPYQ